MNELHENSYDNVAATGNLEQSGNQTKKRKVQEDDDEEEKHENSHEGDVDSSPIHKKKAEVVWSMELHHKFVLAVNQLIISDEVVSRKILELMNVENLTRENVASHLQNYILKLKNLPNKMAASSNANPSNLGMGSLSGVGSFQTLSGSEQFHHNNAFGSFPTGLNNRAGQNVYGSPSSGTRQFGQAPNLNSSNNDQLRFRSAVRHGHPNILQAMPISKWCSNQFPKDIHSHGVCSTCAPKVASNYSNAICSSVNSLTPMNGAVGPECQTSTNPTFNRNQHFHFCDPGQMKHDGIMEFNVGNSLKPQQVHNINHQKSQKSCTCVANNVRSLEELVAASSSCISEELRKEIAATRDEHRKFREKLVQQDRQMQAVLQLFHTMQLQSKPT